MRKQRERERKRDVIAWGLLDRERMSEEPRDQGREAHKAEGSVRLRARKREKAGSERAPYSQIKAAC